MYKQRYSLKYWSYNVIIEMSRGVVQLLLSVQDFHIAMIDIQI